MNLTSLIFGPVAYLVQLYAESYLQSDLKEYKLEQLNQLNHGAQSDTFDFIVVGAGSSGCVVANRLSEHYTVLLLEAGGEPPEQTLVPAFAPIIKDIDSVRFPYQTVPMKDFSPQTGGVLNVPVGRVLGGSGTLNYMFFNRGSPHDYNNWAYCTGDNSWRYENILPFFKTTEKYLGEFPSDQHGIDGELPITSQNHYAPGLKPWLSAGAELGYKTRDPNGPQQISFTPVEFNKKYGRRVSTYTALVKPLIGTRKSLTVVRYAYAEKILLDDNHKAYGVKYTRHGVQHIVLASKEVIISAGSYGSPQLLMRSGIGPTEHLSESQVHPKIDLPVGKNLQDHLKVRMSITVTNSSYCENAYTQNDLDDFFKRGGLGPLSSTQDVLDDPSFLSTLAGQGFAASSRAQKNGHPDWADIQFGLYSQDFTGAVASTPYSYAKCKKRFAKLYPIVYLGRPKSTGEVKLNPNNKFGPPLINFNYLADPSDSVVLIEGIKKLLNVFEGTHTYKSLGAFVPANLEPGCELYPFRSDAYWNCYIRIRGTAGDHPVGTCKMGRGAVDQAVVDSKLKVFGVKALRVIDASIMPAITNANLQAAVIVIAEKGSADILNDWSSEHDPILLKTVYL